MADSQTSRSPASVRPDWFDLAEGTQASRLGIRAHRRVQRTRDRARDRSSRSTPTRTRASPSRAPRGRSVTPGLHDGDRHPDDPAHVAARLRRPRSRTRPIHRLPIHRLPIHRLPIHRLPIHRLLIDDSPIYRLPIHQLPIHRLPIHRLDLPGGWDQVLVDTPFAGELVQTRHARRGARVGRRRPSRTGRPRRMPSAPPPQLIQSLTLDDLDLDGSGLDALTLASLVLGSAPVGAGADRGRSGTPARALAGPRGRAGPRRRRSTTRRSSPTSTPPGSTSSVPASMPFRCGASRSPTRCSPTCS